MTYNILKYLNVLYTQLKKKVIHKNNCKILHKTANFNEPKYINHLNGSSRNPIFGQ